MLNRKTVTALINSALLVLLASIPAFAANTEQMIRDAIAHHDQAEYEQAIELLREVIGMEPDNGFAAYELAFSHQANGDPKECAKVAGRAIRKIRNDEEQAVLMPQLAVMQASCYSEDGQTRKALKTFATALETSPDDFWLNFNISITLAKTGQIDDAISHLQSAIRIDPRHPSPYYVLGGAYYEKGQSLNAFLAYANFLQHEFNTERCVDASRWLIEVMYSHVRKEGDEGNTTIFLSPTSPGDSPDTTSLSLALALSAMASPPGEEAAEPEADSVAEAIANFLGIAGELELESEPDSFFAKHLMSDVVSLEQEGVATAFSYFVVSSAGIDGANQWLASHTEETDALASYFESLSTQGDPEQ